MSKSVSAQKRRRDRGDVKVVSVLVDPEDAVILERVQKLCGIRGKTETFRAALRAYERELLRIGATPSHAPTTAT